jgi:hypothetical protein
MVGVVVGVAGVDAERVVDRVRAGVGVGFRRAAIRGLSDSSSWRLGVRIAARTAREDRSGGRSEAGGWTNPRTNLTLGDHSGILSPPQSRYLLRKSSVTFNAAPHEPNR